MIAGRCHLLFASPRATQTLGRNVGKSFAAVVSFSTGLVALLLFFMVDVVAVGQAPPTKAGAQAAPWWSWIGGPLGAFYVASESRRRRQGVTVLQPASNADRQSDWARPSPRTCASPLRGRACNRSRRTVCCLVPRLGRATPGAAVWGAGRAEFFPQPRPADEGPHWRAGPSRTRDFCRPTRAQASSCLPPSWAPATPRRCLWRRKSSRPW